MKVIRGFKLRCQLVYLDEYINKLEFEEVVKGNDFDDIKLLAAQKLYIKKASLYFDLWDFLKRNKK